MDEASTAGMSGSIDSITSLGGATTGGATTSVASSGVPVVST
jgi:hypothetical protein